MVDIDNQAAGADPELPQYSPVSPSASTERTQHTYQLTDKNGHAWLSLNIHNTSAGSLGKMPCAVEGQPVQGTVELVTQEDRDIKSIHISIIGDYITNGNMCFTFVDVTQEIWTPAHGDPSFTSAEQDAGNSDKKLIVADEKKGRADEQKSGGSSGSTPAPYKGKVVGAFSWPFSLELPKTIELWLEGDLKVYPLPGHTFTRWGRADIQYSISVTVKHNSFLRPSHTLATNAGYMPVIRPSAPSPLRQLAYEQHTPIPGPDFDPEGWVALPPITIAGKLFDERSSEVSYTFALAKPLCYTRGTAVPLHLTIRSEDTHALDLLSTPSAPLVRLRRNTRDNYDAGGVNDLSAWKGNKKKIADLKPFPMMKFGDLVGYVNVASWWSTPSMLNNPTVRTLQGEVHIPPKSRPGAELGLYKYFYDVAVYTPRATGFVAHDKTDSPWQAVEVEVGTAYALGPRPVSYSPPSYEDETKVVQETRGTLFNRFTAVDVNY